ncbi:hypothetical protein [Streptomyces sp. NPDC050856]|uniref:hypothetical protein n=1 Tax=Streptomyces sp. NPDC050856 TaxID=3154939 RepID=UPI003406927A
MYELSLYTFALSPRYDDLVVISQAGINIGNRLLPARKPEELCLPGMRLQQYTGDSLHMLHLPSGARMTATTHPDGHSRQRPVDQDWWWDASVPLTMRERQTLAALPAMTPDAETLLAALAVRFCLRDPNGRWDVGMWFNDPLSHLRTSKRSGGHSRRLDGEGDHWTLQWTSLPYPEDLLQALTDTQAGLNGATAMHRGDVCEIRFGSAVLTLRPSAPRCSHLPIPEGRDERGRAAAARPSDPPRP